MDRYQTTKLTNKMLKAIAGGSVLSAALVAPNIVKVLEPLFKDKSKLSFEQKRLIRHMKRLELVTLERLSDGNYYVMLTEKGKRRVEETSLDDIQIRKPKSWDGKWRIVTFDIPVTMRTERYELLKQFHRLGLERLLQSMWVYPYDCAEEINTITRDLGLSQYVVYLEAKIDSLHHQKLLKHFQKDLSKLNLKA